MLLQQEAIVELLGTSFSSGCIHTCPGSWTSFEESASILLPPSVHENPTLLQDGVFSPWILPPVLRQRRPSACSPRQANRGVRAGVNPPPESAGALDSRELSPSVVSIKRRQDN